VSVVQRREPDHDCEQAEEIIGRLLDLSRRMHTHFDASTAALGLTPAEGHVLHRLDAPAPMRSMADSLCCDASYITAIADRLEAHGLVTREADPADRRVRQLALTDRGRAMREQLVSAIHASTPAMVGLDAAQRDSLLGLLRLVTPIER
jgi:DNA-binding MarR family transcriptional regulator